MTYNYIEQRRQQELAAQQQSNLGWLYPAAAGLGAIALGAYMFKAVGNQGGNVMADMLHFLGRPRGVAVNVEKIANSGASTPASGASGIRSWLTSTFNVSKQEVQLGPIDILKDLGSALEVIGNTRGPIRDTVRQKVVESINRRFANYGNNTSFFSQNLQRITFDEVIGNKGLWSKLLGENQWQTLSASVTHGLAKGSQELDRNIFKTSKGFLRDTRPRNIFMKVGDSGDLVPKMDLFGQFNVFKSFFGERNRFAVLGDTEAVKGPSYFIDGNVFAYTKSKSGSITEHVVARGQKLRLKGDRLEPIRAARENRLALNVKQRTSFIGNLYSKFEEATGVGTSFQNRYPVYQRYITNPIKRLRGLVSGKAELREMEVINHDKIEGLIEEFAGATVPELVTQDNRKVIKIGAKKNFSDLSWYEKIATTFGHSTKNTIIHSSRSGYYDDIIKAGIKPRIVDEDWFIPKPPTGGYTIENYPAESLIKALPGGKTSHSKFYTAPKSTLIPGVTSTRDMASYMMYRVSHLASESLLGISFAPAKSLIGNAARLAAIPVIYEAGRQGINYLDYVTESLIGVSPIKAAAGAYTWARVKQQQLRESIGLQQAMSSAESNFPGSINSGLSFLARSVVAPAITFSALSSSIGIGKAALGAAGMFALIGGESPDQSSESLASEYAGETKVPVRKGRWWGIGTQPLEGGEIQRFDYSWYHKLKSDYKNKSVYGSSDEYWKYNANVFGIPMPTPSNFFGIRNLLNPYRKEEINKNSRPYEQIDGYFGEVPIFGPMLESTIGSVLKPRVYRTPNQPIYEKGLVPGGLTAESARSLGIPEMNSSDVSQETSLSRVNKMANVATEPIGVYKFVMEYFGIKTGPRDLEIASSSNIDSAGKGLYGAELGGAFGQTEFLRRFMLSDYSSVGQLSRQVNRIKNDMPSWIPGTGSEFEKDQSYYLDFGAGSPFDKLAQGEARLPGKGYEALNELESGTPGVYSPVDRFLILADIAPYSAAYAHYEKIVSKMNLDEKWRRKVELAKEYKIKSTSIENRYPRYADSLIAINEHIKDSSLYKSTRSIYDTVTHDFLAEIPLLGSKLAPFRDPYEKYRKQYVEGSEFSSWFTPWEDIQRPALTDIALSNPFMGGVKGAALGFLLGGPMKWASPLTLGPGNSIAGGFIAGAAISAGRIGLGVPDNYVPEYTREQSDTFMYLDALNYTKGRALEEMAIGQGVDPKDFAKIRRKTLVGANTPIMLRASLPTSSDKKYFDVFVNAPEQSRGGLLAGVSPHMAYALNKAWGHGYQSTQGSDEEVYQYMQNKEIPSYDSLVWHPMVDNKSMGLKLVSHGLDGVSDNYHRYGFFESHESTLRSRMPDLWNESITFTPPPRYGGGNTYINNISQNIASNHKSSLSYTPYGSRSTHRLQIDRSNDTLSVVKGRY